MIRIAAGSREVWPGFTLQIARELRFEVGEFYHLSGPNGSGKSSFIHRILLSELRDRKDLYVISVQQQLYMQLYALRAQAAIFRPGFALRNEQDLWGYLWDDLNAQADELPVLVIADEAFKLDLPEELQRPCCVIYSSHRYHLDDAKSIRFEQLDANRTVIHG